MSRAIKIVRLCALLSACALAMILAGSMLDLLDVRAVTSPKWFFFLVLWMLPYVGVLALLDLGRQRAGLLLAASWGIAATSSPLVWLLLWRQGNPTLAALSLLLFALFGIPLQIALSRQAYRALVARSTLKYACGAALVYAIGAALWGFHFVPYRYSVGNEAIVTASMRTIVTAEVTYAATYPSGYAETLRQMCPGAADLLDAVECGQAPGGTARSFTKAGYFFTYSSTRQQGKVRGFEIHADPLMRGESGQRSFYVDQSAVMRANATRPSSAADNPI